MRGLGKRPDDETAACSGLQQWLRLSKRERRSMPNCKIIIVRNSGDGVRNSSEHWQERHEVVRGLQNAQQVQNAASVHHLLIALPQQPSKRACKTATKSTNSPTQITPKSCRECCLWLRKGSKRRLDAGRRSRAAAVQKHGRRDRAKHICEKGSNVEQKIGCTRVGGRILYCRKTVLKNKS